MTDRERLRSVSDVMFSTRRRMGPGSFLMEVGAGLAQRPGRSLLTALGTILGVGVFVAVVGITGSANAQIAAAFSGESASEVTIDYVGPVVAGSPFPPRVERRLGAVPGVRSSGLRIEWRSALVAKAAADHILGSVKVNVVGVSPGFWSAVEPRLAAGRTLDEVRGSRRVAVVGSAVAESVGLAAYQLPTYVTLDGAQFLVAGILASSERDPAGAGTVYVPVGTAVRLGPRTSVTPPSLLVAVDVGAAEVVADQAPLVLDPFVPERFRARSIAEPTVVRDRVSHELERLFLLLAGVSLLIGALGIAIATLISVLDRVPELGLRRALGALPRHVLGQVLVEAAVLGTVGGCVGGSLGVVVTLGVARANAWTAVLSGWLVVAAPAIGGLTGVVAGLYPAIRAALIEPVAALRR